VAVNHGCAADGTVFPCGANEIVTFAPGFAQSSECSDAAAVSWNPETAHVKSSEST